IANSLSGIPAAVGGISFCSTFSIRTLFLTSPGKMTLPDFIGPFIRFSKVAIENCPRAFRTWQPPQRALRIGATSLTKLTVAAPPLVFVLRGADLGGAVLATGLGAAGFAGGGLGVAGFGSGRAFRSGSAMP